MTAQAEEKRATGFEAWSHDRARHFEWAAESMMPRPGAGPKRLIGAMRYAVLGGGKRIRPLLCYAAGEITGADEAVLDRAALALEMIHSYSLVHDDMPSMDNDTLRRGRPTCHVQYGDALQAEAFTVISVPQVPAEIVARLTQTLSRAAGVWGMCGGQALDLAMVGEHPGEAELLRMQAMKTGAMILASVLMGAQSGGWEKLGDGAKAGFSTRSRSALPSRWSTTFSTARRIRRRSAKRPARTKRTTSPPGCRFLVLRAPVSARLSSKTRRFRR